LYLLNYILNSHSSQVCYLKLALNALFTISCLVLLMMFFLTMIIMIMLVCYLKRCKKSRETAPLCV